MAKYLALFGFTSEAIKQFVANPSDRAVVVRRLVESVGGSLECYYWMFGQYDGVAIIEMPDPRTMLRRPWQSLARVPSRISRPTS